MKSGKSSFAENWLRLLRDKFTAGTGGTPPGRGGTGDAWSAGGKSFRFRVKIVAGSAKNEIVGAMGTESDAPAEGGSPQTDTNAVKIRIAAPPEKGKANAELIKFLSKQSGIPAKNFRIAGGASSKLKVIEISP